jgi:hypothetical protein
MIPEGVVTKVEAKGGSDDDDGFAKWMCEDDGQNVVKRHGSLFRMPTPPSAGVGGIGRGSRPSSSRSVASSLSSDGSQASDDENFLSMDPAAAQAVHDLGDALKLAVTVEDYMSAHSLKTLGPKIQKIGENLAVQQAQKMRAIEIEDYDTAQMCHDRLTNGREQLNQLLRHVYAYRLLQRKKKENEHAHGGGKGEEPHFSDEDAPSSDEEERRPPKHLRKGQAVEARLDSWSKHKWFKGHVLTVNIIKNKWVSYNVRFRDNDMKDQLNITGGFFSSTDISGRVIENLRRDQVRAILEAPKQSVRIPSPPTKKKDASKRPGKWNTVRQHFRHRTLKGAEERGAMDRAVAAAKKEREEQGVAIAASSGEKQNAKSDETKSDKSKLEMPAFPVGATVAAKLPGWTSSYGGKVMVVDVEKEEYTICFDDKKMQEDLYSQAHSGLFARVVEGISKQLVHAMYPEHVRRYQKQYDMGIIKRKDEKGQAATASGVTQGNGKKKKRFFGKRGDVFLVWIHGWPKAYGGKILSIDKEKQTCSVLFNDKRLLEPNAPVGYRRVVEDIPAACIQPITSTALRRYTALQSNLSQIKKKAKMKKRMLKGPKAEERLVSYQKLVEKKEAERQRAEEEGPDAAGLDEKADKEFVEYEKNTLVEAKLQGWEKFYGGTVLSCDPHEETFVIRFDDYGMKIELQQEESCKSNIRYGRVIESVSYKCVKPMSDLGQIKYSAALDLRKKKATEAHLATFESSKVDSNDLSQLSWQERNQTLKKQQRQKFLKTIKCMEKNKTWFVFSDDEGGKEETSEPGGNSKPNEQEKKVLGNKATAGDDTWFLSLPDHAFVATFPEGRLGFSLNPKTSGSTVSKAVQGLEVCKVDPGGLATKKRVQENDLLIAVEQSPCRGLDVNQVMALIKNTKRPMRLAFVHPKSSSENPPRSKPASGEAFAKTTLTEDGNDEKLLKLWNVMDADGSGHLTIEELKAGFAKSGLKLNDEQVGKLANHIDKDKSGVIDFDEFKAYIRAKNRNSKKKSQQRSKNN